MSLAVSQRRRVLLRVVAVLLAGLFLAAGCTKHPAVADRGDRNENAFHSAAVNEDLFGYNMEKLDRMDQFEARALIEQTVDQLNGWIRDQEFPADWKPDPLLDTLPTRLHRLPQVEQLGRHEFDFEDGRALLEAIWLRDVCAWADGKTLDDLSLAGQLFDWTIRNVRLPLEAQPAEMAQSGSPPAEAAPPGEPASGRLKPGDSPRDQGHPKLPWEALLDGEAGFADRAWVFVLLCRQRGLDAAVLGISEPGKPLAQAQPWAVGVLIEEKIYLFDPVLGLPIPAPGGVKLRKGGSLEIRPATLDQAAKDEGVLGRMSEGRPGATALKRSQLEKVVVFLEASPAYLAPRMKLVQRRLSGAQKVVLSTDPSAAAARWKAAGHVGAVRLWTHPFDVLDYEMRLAQGADSGEVARRQMQHLPFQFEMTPLGPKVGKLSSLWRGRVLHLKGSFVGDDSAIQCYQDVRPTAEDLDPDHLLREIWPEVEKGLLEKELRTATKAEKTAVLAQKKAALLARLQEATILMQQAKINATYWLGLIAFQLGHYPSAIDYFGKQILETYPVNPWTRGANYNLGRSYEADGQYEQAVRQYRSDLIGEPGQAVRACWLAEAAGLE